MREYDAPAYYHVYNRGADGKRIFYDSQDKYKFISLLIRYLIDDNDYPTYDIELVAYCVMGNHFHLLLYQENDTQAISGLLRSVSTAYSMYFNKKYKHHGHVFQSVFKASRISDNAYLAHISRYIHLNPETYLTYKWSSLTYYTGKKSDTWIHPERVLAMTPQKYLVFIEEYMDRRQVLKTVEDEVAG